MSSSKKVAELRRQAADRVVRAGQDQSTHSQIGRRGFLAGALASALTARALGGDSERGTAPKRYPDPDIIALDKRFEKYKIGNTPIQRLYTGLLWAEGPAWNGV